MNYQTVTFPEGVGAMSDLSNQNAEDMSMGQLGHSKFLLEGAIQSAANDINSGQAPNWAGGSEYSVAGDTMGSAFINNKAAGNAAQMGMSAMEHSGGNSSFIQTNERADPIFKEKPSRKPKNALGHDMSYKEISKLAQQESRALYKFAKTGRMPTVTGGKESVFQTADDVYARSNISGQSLGGVTPFGFKALKVTPEMLKNLGLVPAGVKSSLCAVDKKLQNPDANTIVSTITHGEESGVRMLSNTAGSTQTDIIRRMELDTKPASGMGSIGAPAAPGMGGRA